MPKSRQEKIASFEERIAQLENQKKLEKQRLKAEERKARDRRLYKRAGLLESLLPETITLTDEQFNTFLHRTVANNFGRDKLAQIIAEGVSETAPSQAAAQDTSNAKNNAAKPQPDKTANANKPQHNKPTHASDNAANTQTAARSGA